MTSTIDARINRTGLTVAPGMAEDMVLGAHLTVPSSEGGPDAMAAIRISYAKQAEPLGSIPEPLAEDGSVRETEEAANPVLVDKLGERIAFERAGVRLYDALLSKFDAFGSWDGGPERSELEAIRQQECEHFTLLCEAIAELDGDPTTITPSANLQGVASAGVRSVLTDPRADLRQSLEAILIAELVDREGWESLSDLARAVGHDALAERFTRALEQEGEHLRRVRDWLGVALSHAATGRVEAVFLERSRARISRNGTGDGERTPAAARSHRAAEGKSRARRGGAKAPVAGKARGARKASAERKSASGPKRTRRTSATRAKKSARRAR